MKKNLKTFLLILGSISLALILIGIILRIRFWQEIKKEKFLPPIRKEATSPDIILTFNPQEATLNLGEDFTIDLALKSEKKIAAADFFLSYDHQALNLKEVKPGNFFSNPKELSKEINEFSGRIFYALGSFVPTNGEGAIVSLTFKGKAAKKEAWILLKSNSQFVSQEGERVNFKLPKTGKYSLLESKGP